MTLLEALEELLAGWRGAFRRERSFRRAIEVLIGLVCAHGRKTITSSIRARGLQGDWSADYRVFSRAPWDQRDLFRPVLTRASQIHAELTEASAPLVIHVDDTSTPKCARHPSVRWMKDPLSPPFHVNLRQGLRFLHLAVDLPLHRIGYPARAVSVVLELVPALKKPGKRASAEELAAYRKMKKTHTLGHAAVECVQVLVDQLAAQQVDRDVLLVGDGGYTNRTVLTNLPARVHYLGRTRKDVALYAPAPAGGRRVYGERLPTPEQVRQDESIPYRTTRAHFGRAERDVRFKEVRGVLWRNGARRTLLRLLVLAPMPYEGSHKRLYRNPLICSRPISTHRPNDSSRPIWTAGRSRSSIARRRAQPGSGRQRCGPTDPSSASTVPTSHCSRCSCSPPTAPSVRREPRHSGRCLPGAPARRSTVLPSRTSRSGCAPMLRRANEPPTHRRRHPRHPHNPRPRSPRPPDRLVARQWCAQLVDRAVVRP